MPRVPSLAAMLVVSGCGFVVVPIPIPLPGPSASYALPVFGAGYRATGDPCRRVGEDSYTRQFLDDASDLVACPSDMENLGVFALDTGGVEIARVPDYVLYAVPRR